MAENVFIATIPENSEVNLEGRAFYCSTADAVKRYLIWAKAPLPWVTSGTAAKNHHNLFPIWGLRVLIALIVASVAVALSNQKFDSELLRLSNLAKHQIGDPEINKRLYAYLEFHPSTSLIATPDSQMNKLPGIGGHFVNFSCGYDFGKQQSDFKIVLDELNNSAIQYVLLPPWCDARVLSHFESHPDSYQRIFQKNGALFYKILGRG